MIINDVPTVFSALALGLLGSAHCIGMCGGITAALSLSLAGHSRAQVRGLMFVYHLGRITSYAIAGFLLASLGWYLGGLTPEIKMGMRYLAATRLVAMGLYLIGMMWGWLPCGMVYSALTWSSVQGEPLHGALLMAAFGFGTTPSVLLVGAFSRQLSHVIQAHITRNLAGLLIIIFGLWSMPGPQQRWLMSLL